MFVFGFITGVISFAIVWNFIYERMIRAFNRAVDKIIKTINEADES